MWQPMMAGTLAVALGGCGTIVRGTTEDVVVNTTPLGATVTTSLGHTCPASPCTFKVDRKAEFMVTAAMPGFHPQTHPIGTKVSGGGGAAMAGNVLFGGIIGAGVDVATGAALNHYPNPVYIQLVPLPAAPPPPVARHPRKPAPPLAKYPPGAPGV